MVAFLAHISQGESNYKNRILGWLCLNANESFRNNYLRSAFDNPVVRFFPIDFA